MICNAYVLHFRLLSPRWPGRSGFLIMRAADHPPPFLTAPDGDLRGVFVLLFVIGPNIVLSDTAIGVASVVAKVNGHFLVKVLEEITKLPDGHGPSALVWGISVSVPSDK